MKYTVYQLKESCIDKLFATYDQTMELGGINPNEYEAVFSESIEPKKTVEATLEEIFVKLNMYLPTEFHGHSLSISDIVAIDGVGKFFCDWVGFKKIN